MTTQEMTKQEMIMNLREKREEKKKAKLKAKHRRCTIAIITLVAMMTVIFGTVYSASAKEITITEINEFAGTNETKTVKTRSESVEGAQLVYKKTVRFILMFQQKSLLRIMKILLSSVVSVLQLKSVNRKKL